MTVLAWPRWSTLGIADGLRDTQNVKSGGDFFSVFLLLLVDWTKASTISGTFSGAIWSWTKISNFQIFWWYFWFGPGRIWAWVRAWIRAWYWCWMWARIWNLSLKLRAWNWYRIRALSEISALFPMVFHCASLAYPYCPWNQFSYFLFFCFILIFLCLFFKNWNYQTLFQSFLISVLSPKIYKTAPWVNFF